MTTYPDPTVGGPVGGTTAGGAGVQDESSSPSLGDLLGDITRDVSTLMRQEVALAKAEVTDSAKKAGKGAGMLGGAGVAGHMVLVFLSIALWQALAGPLGPGWSALLVAGLWGIVAAVLAQRGKNEMQKVQGAPRTAETLKKVPNALQGHEEENR